ncbi:hypothetical protein [Maliponia aquimaris]|uniref:Uncharacterized protein n=1 Tax=Maliponia aquimaris TaxID=1673631 RepID=A0A238JPJ1_9RHOB|nr:hypothetical protein [Maliponia aquimaris]SMX31686.1 hypothetical protein MAA8898_00005 [Maliponia aquimaris]
MNRAMKLTLAAIALFFLLTAGTFIWFVATWDPEKEQPVVLHLPRDTAPPGGAA